MLIALSTKNKIGFIDGSISRPAATARNWRHCNDTIFSWIINSVSPEIGDFILYSATAQDAWEELEERFSQSNGAQLYGVHKKLSDFSQGNDGIGTYYTKLKSIRDEINGIGMNPKCSCTCNCGAREKQVRFQEDKKAVEFLMGLNDSYVVVRGTILMQNPLPKVAIIYNNLLQEERQREIHSTVNVQAESAAMLTKNVGYKGNSYNNNNKPFYNSGNASNRGNPSNNFRGNNVPHNNNSFNSSGRGQGNYKGKTPVENETFTEKPKFYVYCKRNNHNLDSCYHLINMNRRFAGNVFTDQDLATSSTAGGFSENQMTDDDFNTAEITATAANFVGNIYPNPQTPDYFNSWILDSDASDHFCSNKALFCEFHAISKPYTVSLPNGDIVKIDTIGTVQIAYDLCLQNMLYVPSFKYNLLSISKLTKQLGSESNLDTYLPNKVDSHSTSLSSSVTNVSCNIWHTRLGHLPVYKMKQLKLCNDFPIYEKDLSICPTCAKARQHRMSFPISSSSSLLPFELIHIDLWGPYNTPTYNGFKYFLTIVEDFTRCTWTHLLTCKSSAFSFIKAFLKMVDTQFDKKVKIIRSDNALELGRSNAISQSFIDNGIIHQTSCIHTPQQNGVVERKHKQLLETA
ncbi:uncharacterized protein LOC141645801 [Silene latifolia]|uniref:uncharacterized protein LOC141645801 n=1 Tax=Silene latifolia TaxID=37657 RepID=UPI003D76FD62